MHDAFLEGAEVAADEVVDGVDGVDVGLAELLVEVLVE
jgi:hypothetical protein